MGESNNTIWGTSIHEGVAADFMPPAELVSPPQPRPVKSRALLWTLTLFSFLGGTFYGYFFRKSVSVADAQVVVVDNGNGLVARWDAKAPGVASLERAQLRVNADLQELVLTLDRSTLRRGEVPLDLDPRQSVEVELAGKGISGRARFVAGDPLDAALIHADADSLRQQIADQKELNTQMERRLRAGVRRFR